MRVRKIGMLTDEQFEAKCKEGNFTVAEMERLEELTGKSFGTILRCFEGPDFEARTTGYRILLSTKGFTIFIPPRIYHQFDKEVDRYLVIVNEDSEQECWICKGDWAFLKIDVSKEELDEDTKDYASDDLEARQRKVRFFLCQNFVRNKQLFPDSDYFTIGSCLKNPDTPLPFRIRLRGNYTIKF